MPAGENPGGAQTFARNLAPGFTHYLSERLEMTLNNEESKKAKTTKGNNV
jgi:hypothetical protein